MPVPATTWPARISTIPPPLLPLLGCGVAPEGVLLRVPAPPPPPIAIRETDGREERAAEAAHGQVGVPRVAAAASRARRCRRRRRRCSRRSPWGCRRCPPPPALPGPPRARSPLGSSAALVGQPRVPPMPVKLAGVQAIPSPLRPWAVVADVLPVVGVGESSLPGELLPRRAAEPVAVDVDPGAVDREGPRGVHGHDAAGHSVPGRGGHASQRHVLERGDPDDLEAPLADRGAVAARDRRGS